MKPLSIRERLALLLGVLTLAFVAAVAVLNDLEQDRATGLVRETQEEKEALFDRLVALKGSEVATFAADYSFWDDMVRFVQTGDRLWAEENIDVGLQTYTLDAVWVYTIGRTLVYSITEPPDPRLKTLPLPREGWAAFASRPFVHFFAETPRGIMEIRGATIHPSADSHRVTPRRGYLFAGRLWNERYVAELAALTETSIRLSPIRLPESEPGRTEAGVISFLRGLPGWSGSPVAQLEVRSEAVAVQGLIRSSSLLRVLAVVFAVLVLVLLSIMLWWWVSVPLGRISASLESGTPEGIAGLRRDRTEFGRLARLIHHSFEQKTALEEEVRQRVGAEEEIRRLNTTLERRVAERTTRLEASRAAEAELLAREQLARADAETARQREERANQAKSEFLSRVSHELRTPLNAILGFAQLLAMDPLTREQQESVDHVLAAGRHLLGLIDEVLDISQIEQGTMALALTPVAVRDVVQECLALMAPTAKDARVDLSAEGSSWPDWLVQAERRRLKQVLLNLLTNAVKYNYPGGAVIVAMEAVTPPRVETVASPRVEAVPPPRREAVSPSRLRVRVTDTGRGIPSERLERLFTPFDRLGAEQVGIEGTGLGLSLSKRLIEAMRGAIGVESVMGKGSTFWIELDLVPASAPAPVPISGASLP